MAEHIGFVSVNAECNERSQAKPFKTELARDADAAMAFLIRCMALLAATDNSGNIEFGSV